MLNDENESATLFMMCSSQGLRAGCVAGVVVNRNEMETRTTRRRSPSKPRPVKVVVDAARRLVV